MELRGNLAFISYYSVDGVTVVEEFTRARLKHRHMNDVMSGSKPIAKIQTDSNWLYECALITHAGRQKVIRTSVTLLAYSS